MAGELGEHELGALGRHWLLYDLAEMGELDEARRRHAELDQLAKELRQPLYRHSSLTWRCVWAGLAGRFEEAERLARESVRLAERAEAPDARVHFVAQLAALRREQGRLDELLSEIECLARGGPAAAAWRGILPVARRGRPGPCTSRIRTSARGRRAGAAADDALADDPRFTGRGGRTTR